MPKLLTDAQLEERFRSLKLPKELQWESLDIASDFMFCKVMLDVNICGGLLRRILRMRIGRIEYPEAQKSVSGGADARSVRLDVYTRSSGGAVFDVEMQMANRGSLRLRARYYRSIINTSELKKGGGARGYSRLPPSYVIFICPFDLFRLGRHIYTFTNTCREAPGLELGDRETTIFLNAKGTADDISPELKAFLDLVIGKKPSDSFTRSIARKVEEARQSSDWRREYMIYTVQEIEKVEAAERRGDRRGFRRGHMQGITQGVTQGRRENALETARRMLESDFSIEQTAKFSGLPVDEIAALRHRMSQ